MKLILTLLAIVALAIYIGRAVTRAKQQRDVHEALKPYAGITKNRKHWIWFIFK